MPDTSFEEFLQAVLDRSDLQEQLKTEINERGIESSYELADLAVEMGNDRGFEFSREAARVSIEELVLAGQRDSGLTQDELDRVAGGVGMTDRGEQYAGGGGVGMADKGEYAKKPLFRLRLDKFRIGR